MPDFESIYQLYFRFVWSTARRLGVGPEAIDDVVQEVFIVIHGKLHTLHHPDALRSWIYSIVRRTVSSHRRKNKTRHEAVPLAEREESLAAWGPSPLDHAEREAQVRVLDHILSQLTDIKREVFVLVELEQLTVPEAAQVLEIPLNTAYSRLRLARQDFETALVRVQKKSERGIA